MFYAFLLWISVKNVHYPWFRGVNRGHSGFEKSEAVRVAIFGGNYRVEIEETGEGANRVPR